MKIPSLIRPLVSAAAVLFGLAPISSGAARPAESFADFTKDGAWCWFADPRAVSRDGKTHAGWVTSEGSIEMATLDHAGGRVSSSMLHEFYQKDDHDNPAFLFLPDGRLMAFYSKHCGPEMNARVTRNPGDSSVWEAERVLAISPKPRPRKNITYPNPSMLSSENNAIHLFWRGDSWKPCHSVSTDGGKTWSPGKVVISRAGAGHDNRPYVKTTSNGKDRIHIVFTDGHPRDEASNNIYYVCYRAGAFYKADGTRIATMEELPFAPEKADLIHDAVKDGARGWVHDLAFDKQDRPVVAYTRYPSDTDHRYGYTRWDGARWVGGEICAAGGWFPQTPAGGKEVEPNYTGGIALDPEDPSVAYLSRPVNGVREIERWTTPDLGKSWTSSPLTAGSKHDNIRPFVVRNAAADGPKVLWMNLSGHYIHYTNYLCSIKMDRPQNVVPAPEVALLPELSAKVETKAVLAAMERVADWQLAHPSSHAADDWTQGAGYAGFMALAGISADPKYRDAMLAMGRGNGWKPGPSVYHADDHCVGQTYAELYQIYREPQMIAPLRERFDFILANPKEGTLQFRTPGNQQRWSWCDALFMAPPAWLRLWAVTGDTRYLDLAVNHWWRTSDYLYDKDEHLYYRDSTYFDKREANGRKVFWGRGNGWVMGGLVRMLQYLPARHPERSRFVNQFREMAAKLLVAQQPDGLWRASLLDPASYPLKETSASGFYAYAFAWGVNQGLLDAATYGPAARKAWASLVGCVRNNGRLTHVQPIGADPKSFPDMATEIYGTGAFLLAGSEIHRMAVMANTRPQLVTVTNPADFHRFQETVTLASSGLPKDPVVMDHNTSRVIPSQMTGSGLIFQTDLGPGDSRRFLILPSSSLAELPPALPRTFCRFVPERLDDFAWESDRIAHRTYGPAIIRDPKEKLVSSGMDVWLKSVRHPVIDSWYRSGDYHADKGEGLDSYKVGPARGCGGLGVWGAGRLHVSSNFVSWKVLSNGPIRSEFELVYAPWDAAGRKVSEVKRMSIDAGSNFTRVESTFSSPSKGPLDIAVGIIKRQGDSHFTPNPGAGWMSYWEPEMPPNGHTACGVVLAGGVNAGVADDGAHHLLVGKATPGKPFVHYFGAGWSKSGDFPDRSAWERAVELLAKRLKSPVIVEKSR